MLIKGKNLISFLLLICYVFFLCFLTDHIIVLLSAMAQSSGWENLNLFRPSSTYDPRFDATLLSGMGVLRKGDSAQRCGKQGVATGRGGCWIGQTQDGTANSLGFSLHT